MTSSSMFSSVDAVRSGIVESRHRVSAAAVDAEGRLVAWTGDPDLVTYWRSCAKPFQAIPLVADGAADAFRITDAEVAVACASHNGELRHLALVTSMLQKAGAGEDDLACGPHPSLSPAVSRAMAERGQKPRKIHSNCSGKHAAMLALSHFYGWPKEGYQRPIHPVQRRLLTEVANWTGVPENKIGQGVDGCGVVSCALPLRAMALAYARLGLGVRGSDLGSWVPAIKAPNPNPETPNPSLHAADRIIRAIVAEPFLIAGTGRLCTEIISASGGKVIAKVGAAGVYCATVPEARLGIALKVEDGDGESAGPALLAMLDVLAPGAVQVADSFRSPSIMSTLGEEVGHLVARLSLERAG